MIIETFNLWFFVLFAIFAAFVRISVRLMKDRDRKSREKYAAVVYTIFILILLIYKVSMKYDMEYEAIEISNHAAAFSVWRELPLNLCNICLILLPLACVSGKRHLYGLVFFIAPVSGLLALCMPDEGFSGYSLFLPRIIGFYLTHFALLVSGVLIYLLGLYRPRFSDIPRIYLWLLVFTIVVFCVNILLHRTGLYPNADYMYLMSPDNVPFFEMLWERIPIPMLYVLIPVTFIVVPYMLILTLVFEKAGKKFAGENGKRSGDLTPVFEKAEKKLKK